jgi:transcriptional regulator with XRE-family HTH domain
MATLTPFGKAVRKYRIDRGETQGVAAEALGVSVTFFSAIETGKKNVPESVMSALIQHFELDCQQADELRHLAETSRAQVKLDVTRVDAQTRELVAGFARKFDSLDEEQIRKIREILGGG